MPISTPEHLVKDYGGDAEHFKHVLECLFIPAVEAADMMPIPPIAKGSEVIHASFIKHLQTADLVLMDMSTLNANAFFEWGIRTSLNKPVCVVRDTLTPASKIPFDAAPINSEPYDWRLDAWIIKSEIPKLTTHLNETLRLAQGTNALWKHFGFQQTAELPGPPSNDAEKLDLIVNQMATLTHRLNEADLDRASRSSYIPQATPSIESAYAYIGENLTKLGLKGTLAPKGSSEIIVTVFGVLNNSQVDQLNQLRARVREMFKYHVNYALTFE
jgi:hypothetical protein